MIIGISFDKFIEVLSPVILLVCIIAFVGLNTDYGAKKEQERLQALENYEVSSNKIDCAEILNRYFADGDLKFTDADKFTSHSHYDDGNYDVYTRYALLCIRYERVQVNSETQEIMSYLIIYDGLTANADLTKAIINDYSDFIKGKFDETAQWSKQYNGKQYNASAILSHISSRKDDSLEMLHSDTEKRGNDYHCLISSHGDTVDISLSYEFQ